MAATDRGWKLAFVDEVRTVLVEAMAGSVLTAQSLFGRRGLLPIWTVYDRPTDFPTGHIARCHTVGKGGGVTDFTLDGPLDELQDAFRLAGLTRITRHEDDEPHIVEVWL
jgi:hypothetical protein